MKLNIGCGGVPLKGYKNLDERSYPHVDIMHDLSAYGSMRWKNDAIIVQDDSFDRMQMNHVFEHLTQPFTAMEELWRVAKHGCELHIRTPYGSSDNADEDPTHVRRVFKDSFVYFSQAIYGTNDYGYRADWDCTVQKFVIEQRIIDAADDERTVWAAIDAARNIVSELRTILVAVKPARKPGFIACPTRRELKVLV